MKTKIGKDIDAVRNGEQLHAWMQEAGDQIDRLTADVRTQSDLTGTGYVQNEDQEQANFQLAKYFMALRRGDTSTIKEMGGQKMQYNRGKQEMEIKTLLGTPGTGDDSGGDFSYSIPTRLYGNTILRYLNTSSEIIPNVRRVPMEGRLIRWPVETASCEFAHVTNEVTAKSESNPTMSYIDLECETFAGWLGVSDEYQEDSFIDLGQWIRQMVSQNLIDTIEEQLLSSAGAPFTGVMSYTSNVSHTMGGTGFEDVGWDDLRDCKNALDTKRKRQRCAYVMHSTVWDILCTQVDAMGRYYFDPSRGVPRNAWGYPVYLSDAMPDEDASSTDTPFIFFGPLEQIMLGTRVGLEIRYYPDTKHSVEDDQNFYRFRTRFAVKSIMESAFSICKTAAS